MLAGEYNRTALRPVIQFTGIPAIDVPNDVRSFYVMGSYKLAEKLTAGIYVQQCDQPGGCRVQRALSEGLGDLGAV